MRLTPNVMAEVSKVADVKVVPGFHFAPGTIVIDDRGHTDYALKWKV